MISRRDLLTMLGSAGGLSALAGATPSWLLDLGRQIHRETEPARENGGRRLTPHEHRTVTLAAERILPRTDTPGATDARVADFIDVIVADWYSPAEHDRFLAGLAELDARARDIHGRSFVDSGAWQPDTLLRSFDADVTRLRRVNARAADEHWFAMLKFLTVWGFYTSRVGMIDVLKVQLHAGRYDGNAPYSPPPPRPFSAH